MPEPALPRNLSRSPASVNRKTLPFGKSPSERFAIIPVQVLGATDLSSNDKIAYCALALHADRSNRRCWPSIPTLMKAAHMPQRTLLRSLGNLERFGYLLRDRKPNRVTIYTVLSGNCPDCKRPLPLGADHCDPCGWNGGANLAVELPRWHPEQTNEQIST